MRVLVTGFEPFGGRAINPSQETVRALGRMESPDGVELFTRILPVEDGRAEADLISAVERSEPDAVICLGEASNRPIIAVERVFINLKDYPMADNRGVQVRERAIVSGGPATYFATLPVREIVESIQEGGIPVSLSTSAGTFLCNQVAYGLLHHLHERHKRIAAGFIHVPRLPEQMGDLESSGMPLETMVEAIRAYCRSRARSRAKRRPQERARRAGGNMIIPLRILYLLCLFAATSSSKMRRARKEKAGRPQRMPADFRSLLQLRGE